MASDGAIQCSTIMPKKLLRENPKCITSPLFLPLRREENRICSDEMG